MQAGTIFCLSATTHHPPPTAANYYAAARPELLSSPIPIIC
jgi:hypothetical protein